MIGRSRGVRLYIAFGKTIRLYVLVTSSKERHNLRHGHILSAGSRQQENVREMILSGNIFGKRKD